MLDLQCWRQKKELVEDTNFPNIYIFLTAFKNVFYIAAICISQLLLTYITPL